MINCMATCPQAGTFPSQRMATTEPPIRQGLDCPLGNSRIKVATEFVATFSILELRFPRDRTKILGNRTGGAQRQCSIESVGGLFSSAQAAGGVFLV